MYKEILFGKNIREKILDGVNVVADAVSATLWPRGTNVIFEETSYPAITKDGVTVAQNVVLKDKFKNMWVMVAKEAAENTNKNAWDGTTSTIVILRDIMNEWHKYVTAGMNPVLLKRWMEEAMKQTVEILKTKSKEVNSKKEKLSIATISANNDPILGALITWVVEKIGSNGVVSVTMNRDEETSVDYVKGTKTHGWYEHQVFINDQKRLIASLDNPEILVTSDEIIQQSQLVDFLQNMLENGKRDIVIYADKVDQQALAFLVQNYIQWKFRCVPVRLPSFSWYQEDILQDLAALVWANVVGEWQGKSLAEATIEDTGIASNVKVWRDFTIVTWGKGKISERIDNVTALLRTENDLFKKEKLKERLWSLNGKIANIKVWGSSETEQQEIKYRIEDALNATKSAIEEGIVEWAWVTLLRCSDELKNNGKTPEEKAWFDIIKKALQSPFKTIIENGWENADAIMWKILEWTKWYNSLTNQIEDLFKAWVIDPAKVVRNEVLNAVSTAWILLTSSVGIITKE